MPAPQDLPAFGAKLARLGETDRFWRINRAESLWHGGAYDSRPSFWDGSVPLRDRAPAVQSMIARTATRRLVSLVFGERAFPSLTVAERAFAVSLDETQRAALLALVEEIIKSASLRRAMREVMTDGLRAGTTCAVQSIREGRPSTDIVPAKWCQPSFGPDGRTLAKLVIEYKFPRDGRWYVHRREIAPPRDVTYEPVECQRTEHGAIDWSKIPIAHSAPCAFVPAVWHRNMVECVETSHDVDGYPICHGLEDEIGALDMELSQLYRNALYNGEPQLVRTGIDTADPSSSDGMPRGKTAKSAGVDGGSNYISLAQQPAVRKGGGNLWDLPPGSDAKMVESSGAGAQIITTAIEQLRRVLLDALGVVLADPQQLGSGDLSARALTLLLAPMLGTADDLRVEYGDTLIAILDQHLRLCAMTPGRINLATLEAARPALAALFALDGAGSTVWLRAPLEIAWGEYFEPSWSEMSAALDVARKANGDQPVLTLEESRALVEPLLGIKGDSTKVKAEQQQWVDATTRAFGTAPSEPVSADSVADTAFNSAQVSSLVEILGAVGRGEMPVETAAEVILAAFPSVDEIRVRRMVAPYANRMASARATPAQETNQ
jgi:hypothetical protein